MFKMTNIKEKKKGISVTEFQRLEEDDKRS